MGLLASGPLSFLWLFSVTSVLITKKRVESAPTASTRKTFRLISEWVRPQLELHSLARRALAAFQVPGRAGRIRRPQPFAFPAAFRIVDAPIHALGEEAHRVGNSEDNPLSGGRIQSLQGVVPISCDDRYILAHAECVELIDPVVIV